MALTSATIHVTNEPTLVVNVDDFGGGCYVVHVRVSKPEPAINVHLGGEEMDPTGGLLLRGGEAPYSLEVCGESLYAASDEPGGADLTVLAYTAPSAVS